ncbi:MAG: MBL fold metallo-hydrolase, partial [Desulfobacteraceae bacterium]|nr:MBL fold metallo-hydrolase [Desulfobacteraceae bacterium]
MKKYLLGAMVLVFGVTFSAAAQDTFETDSIATSAGDLTITFIGHGTLMFNFGGKVIHVDPWSELADYSQMPPADLILITHEHRDHLDVNAVNALRKSGTVLVVTETCAKSVKGGVIMKNGDIKSVEGLEIEAVPA